MASAERFALFPCSFIHGAAQTLNLAQMQNFDAQTAAAISRRFVSGAVDPKANILVSADPRVSFGTRDLATYFGTISPTVGLALTGAGATFRLQERSTLDGVWETSTTHETFTCSTGLILPRRISASQDDQDGAVLESELVVLYDGSTQPIVHNTGVDFATAPTPAFTSEFFLGPVYHNGSEIGGVTQVSVDFGINFAPRRVSGQYFATKGAIVQRAPMFTFTILKVDARSAINKFIAAITSSFAVYFWKGADAGSRVAVGTGAHCKISCTAGVWNDQNISARENDDGTVTVQMLPTGTIAVSVASAIP